MSDFYKLIQECTGVGTLDKERIMQSYKLGMGYGYGVKDLFRLMLDKSIVFGITSVRSISESSNYIIKRDENLVDAINGMLGDALTGADLKKRVREIYLSCTPELQQVFQWVLARKNPAGIGTSLVDKVYPGLIYKQQYMGAIPGTQEALERLPWDQGIAVQVKEDGMALLVRYINGVPTELHTRNGQDITRFFPEFLSRCNHMGSDFNAEVHHEIYVQNPETLEFLGRKTGNGLINKCIKNNIRGGSVDNCIRSVLLDMYTDQMQCVRYTQLSNLSNEYSTVVKQDTFYKLRDARKQAHFLIRYGQEGAICKAPYEVFSKGKPWHCVKIKNEFSVDLVCTGWTEHSTTPGTIGSLEMESSDGLLKVNVGSGLTDSLRDVSPDEYMNKIITVKANEVIQSKGKKESSLYLPRFDKDGDYLRIRTKAVADSLEDIINQFNMSKGV